MLVRAVRSLQHFVKYQAMSSSAGIDDLCLCVCLCFLSSVHLRVEEKISLTSGRDGGLQNMEVLGMVTLRVMDDKNGRIRLIINNNDNKGLQLQVRATHFFSLC